MWVPSSFTSDTLVPKKSCKPITTENKEKFTFPTIFQLLFVHNK